MRQLFKYMSILCLMDAEKALMNLGFSSNETKIYVSLLGAGPCLVSSIVEHTKLNRTHVYDRLFHLLQKGFVTYTIRSGKKYFSAVSPQILLDKFREQEANLAAVVPTLSKLQRNEAKTLVEVYEGKEGLKSLLQDILKEKKTVYVIGFRGEVARQVEYFYPWFQKDRIKLGIKRKILVDPSLPNLSLIKEKRTTIRFLPKHVPPVSFWLYSHKTVLFIPDTELCMVLITSQKVAQSYLSYFNLIWAVSPS